MICRGCEAAIPGDSRFCPRCGAQVPELDMTVSSSASVTEHQEPARGEADSFDWVPTVKQTDPGSRTMPVSRASYLWALLGVIGGIIGWATVKDKDPRMARNILFAGIGASVVSVFLFAVLPVMLAFSAMDSDDSTSAEDSPSVVDSDGDSGSGGDTVYEGAGGIDVEGQPTSSEFSWTYVDDIDAQVGVDGMIDEPLHLSDSPYVEWGDGFRTTPGQACGVTDDSVALVPIDMSLTNRSDSEVQPQLTFSMDVDLEVYYSDTGATCHSAGEDAEVAWDPLSAGSSAGVVAVAFVPDDLPMSQVTFTAQNSPSWGVVDIVSGTSRMGNSFTLGDSQAAVASPADGVSDISGTYTGTMTAYKSEVVYDLELSLTQVGEDVTGTVTATSRDTGNRGTYETAGYLDGDRLVLNGTTWIHKPNDSWFMDHIDVVFNGSALTGEFASLDRPGKAVGSVYATR